MVIPGQLPARYIKDDAVFKLPFNELLAGLSAKQKQFDEGIATQDKLAGLRPKAGYSTEADLAKWDAQFLPQIEALTNELVTTGNYNKAKGTQLASSMVNNPLYQKIQRDYEYRPQVEKMIQEKAKGNILHFQDAQGNFIPMGGDSFDPSHYGQTLYADPHQYVQDNAKLIKPYFHKIKEAGLEWSPELGSYIKKTTSGRIEIIDDAKLAELFGPDATYIKSMWESNNPAIEYFKADRKRQGLPADLGAFSDFSLGVGQIMKVRKDGTSEVIDETAGKKVAGSTQSDKSMTPISTPVTYVAPGFKVGTTDKEVTEGIKALEDNLNSYQEQLTNPMSLINTEFSKFFQYPSPLTGEIMETVPIVTDEDGIQTVDINKMTEIVKGLPQELQQEYANKLTILGAENQKIIQTKNNLQGTKNLIEDLKRDVGYDNIDKNIIKEADKIYSEKFESNRIYNLAKLLKANLGVSDKLKLAKIGGSTDKEYVENATKIDPAFVDKYNIEASTTANEIAEKYRNTHIIKDPNAKAYYDRLKAINESQQFKGKRYGFAGFNDDEKKAMQATFNVALNNILTNPESLKYVASNKNVLEDDEEVSKKILEQLGKYTQENVDSESGETINKSFNLSGLRWDKADGWMLDVYVPGLEGVDTYTGKKWVEIPIDVNQPEIMNVIQNVYKLTDASFNDTLENVNSKLSNNRNYTSEKTNNLLGVPLKANTQTKFSRDTESKSTAVVNTYKVNLGGIEFTLNSPIEVAKLEDELYHSRTLFANKGAIMTTFDGKLVDNNSVNRKTDFTNRLRMEFPMININQADLLFKKIEANFQ